MALREDPNQPAVGGRQSRGKQTMWWRRESSLFLRETDAVYTLKDRLSNRVERPGLSRTDI